MPILDDLIRAMHADHRTWYAVAKSAGVSQTNLQSYADGRKKPSLETAEKIAASLGFTLVLEKSGKNSK
jgi:DNA-binding XRE family transcriptional regulator